MTSPDATVTLLLRLTRDADALLSSVTQSRSGALQEVDIVEFSRWQSTALQALEDAGDNTHSYAATFREKTRSANSVAVQAGLGILTAAIRALSTGTISASAVHFEAENAIDLILERFHLVAHELSKRHDKRTTISIRDEYDVQDLLRALLYLHFDDVRAEEWTPSYAGKSSRIDFILKAHRVALEVKKTRAGLGAAEVGSQLLEDIGRYRVHPDCGLLLCFVYDPDRLIQNPRGLERDLTETIGNLRVRVLVRPQ